MRPGRYRLDTSRAATKAAVTAAVLATAIEGAGLDSVPVAALAAIVQFLVQIERVGLAPGDELVVERCAPVPRWVATTTTGTRPSGRTACAADSDRVPRPA